MRCVLFVTIIYGNELSSLARSQHQQVASARHRYAITPGCRDIISWQPACYLAPVTRRALRRVTRRASRRRATAPRVPSAVPSLISYQPHRHACAICSESSETAIEAINYGRSAARALPLEIMCAELRRGARS